MSASIQFLCEENFKTFSQYFIKSLNSIKSVKNTTLNTGNFFFYYFIFNMYKRKLSDRDKINIAVSKPMRELRNSNIPIQQFVQLFKTYSKGSPDTTVVTREDLWKFFEYINENSTDKIDVKLREFQKSREFEKDIFITYHALKSRDLMLNIAEQKFKCVPIVEKLHNVNVFCKKWVDLVEEVHQKSINHLFSNAQIFNVESIVCEEEEEEQIQSDLFDDYGNWPWD